MDQGVFLNLFEISTPSQPIPVMVREWEEQELPLDSLRQQLLPARLFASSETQKLYAYGQDTEKAKTCGFEQGEFHTDADPRFTGRLIIEAVAHYLSARHGFEPQHRLNSQRLKSCEMTHVAKPLQQVERRIDVYPSYKIQSLFLKISDQLRYFLLVTPKVRYRFVHTLPQINASVSCVGKFVRVVCPAACEIYDCPLYEYRGRLAGKFAGLTNTSEFKCRFPNNSPDTDIQYVQLGTGSRLDFAIPSTICELEASTSNISAIFSQRFSLSKASSIISELRILAGDLLPGSPRAFVNTEVGQKHWSSIAELIGYLKEEIPLFNGPSITITQEPVRAIEGGFIPDDLFLADEDEEAIEDETDDSDDEAF